MGMNQSAIEPPPDRADWLRVLALADPAALQAVAAPVVAEYRFEPLRGPESGLVMVRARIGNQGDRYNLGEVTVTRCTVRHLSPSSQTCIGVGHVLGRDEARAACVARLDALLQRPDLAPLLWRDVVEPLRAQRAERLHDERARTEASRVRFFTLQPEST